LHVIKPTEMFKKTVSIFFTVLFLGIISVPSIIVVIDDSINISLVPSTSEEEKGNEKHVDIEVFVSKGKANESYLALDSSENNLGYYNKKYPKPHLNFISPPPQFNCIG